MRAFFRLYCPALLILLVASTTFAQTRTTRQARASVSDEPMVATTSPIVRVTTENPREINRGNSATFIFARDNPFRLHPPSTWTN